MKIVRNEKLIKRNKTIGSITSFAGIIILAGGLILNLRPTNTGTLISFGALIVGFIVAQVSTYFVSRFGRSPRYDEVIASNLEKLSNNYTFYVYSAPVPLLLVGPEGLWIPIPISAGGEIYFDKKWKQRGGSLLLKFFGQENIGRPQLDVQSYEKTMTEFLTENLNLETLPPIKSILVLIHPKGIIGDVANAPTPLVEPDALRRKIRLMDRKTDKQIEPDLSENINQALLDYKKG